MQPTCSAQFHFLATVNVIPTRVRVRRAALDALKRRQHLIEGVLGASRCLCAPCRPAACATPAHCRLQLATHQPVVAFNVGRTSRPPPAWSTAAPAVRAAADASGCTHLAACGGHSVPGTAPSTNSVPRAAPSPNSKKVESSRIVCSRPSASVAYSVLSRPTPQCAMIFSVSSAVNFVSGAHMSETMKPTAGNAAAMSSVEVTPRCSSVTGKR